MKVRMKVGVSGPRHDGQGWPRVGEVIDVPDWEGADLCSSGLGVPVAEAKAETAVAPKNEEVRKVEEKRRPGRPRKDA